MVYCNYNNVLLTEELKLSFSLEFARGSKRRDFLSEIDMMKAIYKGHNPNVIGMVGCVTLQEPFSLILEYVTYGELLSYLRMNMRMVRK